MGNAIEDYIKNIYSLQASGLKVSTNNLARRMGVSMPSVSEMVKKLSADGYLTNIKYRGFTLTVKGEKSALMILRKHRLLELFLIKVLKYDWEDVHAEAEILEHSISDTFIAKIDALMGYPKLDPHGHPIPDLRGRIHAGRSIPLKNAKAGKYYSVSSVDDKSREILMFLKNTGINVNTKFRLNGFLEYDDSVLIQLKGKNQLLSKKIADTIFVSAKHN